MTDSSPATTSSSCCPTGVPSARCSSSSSSKDSHSSPLNSGLIATALGVIGVLGSRPLLDTPGSLLVGCAISLASFLTLRKICSCSSRSPKITCGIDSQIGRRNAMEDFSAIHDPLVGCSAKVSFFGVFDGHGGDRTAEYVSKAVPHLLKEDRALAEDPEASLKRAFEKADADCIASLAPSGDKSGSTGVTCMISGDTLYVADVGDSEAILVKDVRSVPCDCTPKCQSACTKASSSDGESDEEETPAAQNTAAFEVLTKKHLAVDPEERQRLKDAGAIVFQNRVFGVLVVSRAFGDADFKGEKIIVSSEPHTAKKQLREEDSILILASDGLWDRINYADASEISLSSRKAGVSPAEIAKKLCTLALQRGSYDNVTVIVVFLSWT